MRTRALLPALLGLLAGSAVQAKPAAPEIKCRYRGGELLLEIAGAPAGAATVSSQAVDVKGRRVGPEAKKEVQLAAGSTQVALEARPAVDHWVRVRGAGAELKRFCPRERGEWAAGPASLGPKFNLRAFPEADGLMSKTDLKLAAGYSAYVTVNPKLERFVVERTFGERAEHGIRPPREGALALVARGSVGPVRITAAQRLAPGKLSYWDYHLVLSPEFRRYSIPLAAFRYRGIEQRPITTLHSIAIQSSEVAKVHASIDVAGVALAAAGPRLGPITETATGVSLKIVGPQRKDLTVHHAPAKGAEVKLPVPASRQVAIADARGGKVWLCYREESGAESCDPPDAPSTRYALPTPAGVPFLIDDFSTLASVSSYRQPVSLFASRFPVEEKLRVRRSAGALRLSYELPSTEDYVGYQTDLPPKIPAGMESLELRVRGKTSPQAVNLGLRGEKGVEARLALGSYLDRLSESWAEVRVPLAAFRAAHVGYGGKGELGRLRRLGIAAVGTEEKTGWVELGPLRFSPGRAPVALARFEGPRPRLDDLAGPLGVETAGGARLEPDWRGPGKIGHGLAVAVSSIGGPRYALVSLGLGRLDTTGYQALTLWVRGERGGEDAEVVLHRGAHRAKVRLSAYGAVTPTWSKVRIPLADFAAKVTAPRKPVPRDASLLVFLWGDRPIDREKLYLDEIWLE